MKANRLTLTKKRAENFLQFIESRSVEAQSVVSKYLTIRQTRGSVDMDKVDPQDLQLLLGEFFFLANKEDLTASDRSAFQFLYDHGTAYTCKSPALKQATKKPAAKAASTKKSSPSRSKKKAETET